MTISHAVQTAKWPYWPQTTWPKQRLKRQANKEYLQAFTCLMISVLLLGNYQEILSFFSVQRLSLDNVYGPIVKTTVVAKFAHFPCFFCESLTFAKVFESCHEEFFFKIWHCHYASVSTLQCTVGSIYPRLLWLLLIWLLNWHMILLHDMQQ